MNAQRVSMPGQGNNIRLGGPCGSRPPGPPPARPARGRRGRAFSLLELVLVLAILATVSAIAMPRLAVASARYQVETAARRVAADLRLARARAQAASASQSVVFTLSPARYSITGMADLDRPANAYQVNLAGEPYRCELLQATFGGDQTVVFDGFGRPDSAGTIELRCGVWTKTLTLERSGEVSGV